MPDPTERVDYYLHELKNMLDDSDNYLTYRTFVYALRNLVDAMIQEREAQKNA